MNRRAFATPTVKAVLAGVVTLSAVTAAGLSYLSTRNTRDFSPSANLKHLDDHKPSNRATPPSTTADDTTADAPAETLASDTEPARTFASSSTAAQIQESMSAIAAKISSMAQIVSTAGAILGSDRDALAERATMALAPLILGTPEAFSEALKSLGASPSDAASKPGGDAGKPAEPRTPPFTEVLAGAELDLENITIAAPKEPDFGGAGRTPSPGSGAYRAPADADGNSDAAPKRITLGAADLPAGLKPKGFEATMMARIGGAFPEVEKRHKELPSVEVSIPARTKGSSSTQPDMDIGVTMTKGPDGNWVPTGYTVRVKNPDVLQTMMKSRRGPG
jgi:hypothetical protein